MPKSVRIRDIDDEVYAALSRHAADSGITVPELLRREATRLGGPTHRRGAVGPHPRRPSDLSRLDVLEAFDEMRGPWPGADCQHHPTSGD